MAESLTRSQQSLRGKKVTDLTGTELREWLDTCTKMEVHVKPGKAQRSWKSGAREAEAELLRRASRSGK